MLRSLVGSEMCIRDRYQRRVRGTHSRRTMATAQETILEIMAYLDANSDGRLTKEELVSFFDMLKSALPDEETRSSDDEARDLIEEHGEDGTIAAKMFQGFLEGFVNEEEDKVARILEACHKTRKILYNTMLERVKGFDGFLAALDQSGGSTAKALLAYGVEASEYNGDAEMFDKIHDMRTRIVSSPAFNGDDVLGAILFEMTMDGEFHGMPAARFLWEKLNVVPFVKCDKGLMEEENGVQLMKPMPQLDNLLIRASAKGVFGTKMRSRIAIFNEEGIKAIVAQQFEVGKQIIARGLCPILEPEVDIHSATKQEAEALLKTEILAGLDTLEEGQEIMLKLSLPTETNLYKDLVDHPRVVKVVALSGGYTREEANEKLAEQNGMVASFSRALTEGLNAAMSDEEYNAALEESIKSIHAASRT
eukprot:TRINITY_DN5662_c0_g1_i1.p1 TRINITY_DN5662_c0_g1~~TRINITY_DN5662_c0_g1_i1.p1  ORF type:complete len:421 (+),score=153.89 TRINITY_DN5662_c0_g1_i1:167-1429(+)